MRYKILLNIFLLLIVSSLVYATVPSMENTRILPVRAYTNTTLEGYCNASDADSDNLLFYYRWYKDDAIYSEGKIENMSDIGAPLARGSVNDSDGVNSLDTVRNVFVQDDYVYTVSYTDDTLSIWNASNKNNIVPLGSVTDSDLDNSLDGVFAVYVLNDYAYTVSFIDGCLSIWNVTDKNSITPLDSVTDISGDNSLAGARSVFVVGNYVYTGSSSDDTLSIWNATDKNNIIPLGSVTVSSGNNSLNGLDEIHVVGDYIYTLGPYDDVFSIWNATDKNNIIPLGFVNKSDGNNSIDNARALYVLGDYAYIGGSNDDTLTIWNITDKNNITSLGSVTDSEGGNSLDFIETIHVEGDLAYTGSPEDDTLTIWNVTDKNNITSLGSITASDGNNSLDYLEHLFVSNGYIYTVSNFDDTLSIWATYEQNYNESIEYNINNLESDNTSKEQTWILSCLSNDGVSNSSWLNSSSIEIFNYPPSVNSVSLVSNEYRTNLTFINTSTDIDSDTITDYNIVWYKNGIRNTTWNNLTVIQWENATLNDNFTVALQAYDGTNWSKLINSSQISIVDTIRPNLSNDLLSSALGINDAPFTIYVDVKEYSSLNFVKVQITDPESVKSNVSMNTTDTGTTKTFSISYTPLSDGVYNFDFFAQDISLNNDSLNSALSYTDSTVEAASGGGGGGGSIIDNETIEEIVENKINNLGYIRYNSPGHTRGIFYLPTDPFKKEIIIQAVDGDVNASLLISSKIASYFNGEICDLRTDQCNKEMHIKEGEDKYIKLFGNLSDEKFMTEFMQNGSVEGYVTVLNGNYLNSDYYNISLEKYPSEKIFDSTYEFTVKLNKKNGYNLTHKTIVYLFYIGIIGILIMLCMLYLKTTGVF